MGKLYKIDGTVTEITPKDPKRGLLWKSVTNISSVTLLTLSA